MRLRSLLARRSADRKAHYDSWKGGAYRSDLLLAPRLLFVLPARTRGASVAADRGRTPPLVSSGAVAVFSGRVAIGWIPRPFRAPARRVAHPAAPLPSHDDPDRDAWRRQFSRRLRQAAARQVEGIYGAGNIDRSAVRFGHRGCDPWRHSARHAIFAAGAHFQKRRHRCFSRAPAAGCCPHRDARFS